MSPAICEERSRLLAYLTEDFGDLAATIMPLCCSATDGRPMYLSHVRMAMDCLSPDHPPRYAQALERGYIYSVAACYIVDAIADGHPCHASPLPPRLLAAHLPLIVSQMEYSYVSAAGRAVQHSLIRAAIKRRLIENLVALGDEAASWEEPQLDGSHMWARSNVLLLLFDVAYVYADASFPAPAKCAWKRALAALQRGDDACDWEEDLIAQRFTPFLWSCGVDLKRAEVASIEEIVYSGGRLERELQSVDGELAAAAGLLEQLPGVAPAVRFLTSQQVKVQKKLTSLQRVRLEVADD